LLDLFQVPLFSYLQELYFNNIRFLNGLR
jgi:hypothetical protein